MSDEDEKDDAAEGSDARTESDDERSRDEAPPRSERPRSAKLAKRARREEAERKAKQAATTRAIGIGVVALAAGALAGWFGHIEQAKAKIKSESAPAAAGSAGPCGAWEKKLCSSNGEQSAVCQQAKGASGLLTPGTCEVALEAMPATLAKVKAERASCDTLMDKLCKELTAESKTCKMVRDRTPAFPAEQCKNMLQNYDQVLNELKQIEARPQGEPGIQITPEPHGADDGHGH